MSNLITSLAWKIPQLTAPGGSSERAPPPPPKDDLTSEVFGIADNFERGALIDSIGARAGVKTPDDPSLLGKVVPEKIDRRASEISRSLIEQAMHSRRDLKVNGHVLSDVEKAAIRDPKTRVNAAFDAGQRLARREALVDAAGGSANLDKIEGTWRTAAPEQRAQMQAEGQKLADERAQVKQTVGDVMMLAPGAPGAIRAGLRAPAMAKGAYEWTKNALTGRTSRDVGKLTGAPKAPGKPWDGSDEFRTNYLKTAPKEAADEVAKLSSTELRAIYPEGGAVPDALHGVAKFPGFADFARANPKQARILSDANASFANIPSVVNDQIEYQLHRGRAAAGGNLTPAAEASARNRGFLEAARISEARLPEVVPHPSDPRYTIATRRPDGLGWQPEVEMSPTRALDHNGAFAQSASAPTAQGGKEVVRSHIQARTPIRPGQIVADGKPLDTMDGVFTFGAHGGRNGFQGLTTKEAAHKVAAQIEASSANGTKLDKVVLDACHQRDRRWFFGGSNAQAFERELNQELAQRGLHRVQVFAADRGGPLYGNQQRSWLGSPDSSRPAVYTPAADGARFYMTPSEALRGAGIGVGVMSTGAGGYVVYRVVTQER